MIWTPLPTDDDRDEREDDLFLVIFAYFAAFSGVEVFDGPASGVASAAWGAERVVGPLGEGGVSSLSS